MPIGLVAAVYLDVTRSRPARFFRTVVEAMTALPSILAGLFIYASWILAFGFGRSGLAAALALSVMMLPYIIRAADLALRLVPGNLREAAAALGAPGWRGEMQVVLPTARSGLATAVILGIARAIGEASPVLLTAGFTTYINANPLNGTDGVAPAGDPEAGAGRRARLHLPGLRLRLLPPVGGHRPVRRGPQDRRVGPGPPDQAGTAPGGGGLGPRRDQIRRATAAPPAQELRARARFRDRGEQLMTATRPPGRRRPGSREPRAAASPVTGALVAAMVAVLSTLVLAGTPAGATAYVPVSGEGSSWSANAINQWIADVQPDGMRVNYTANGSTTGRQDFIKGLTDFAASDIPFQTDPNDGSAPENPQPDSYAYMPITAGGTVFMYNLKINGQQVTNLRLSGENITKIFTGAITNWDNPALAADNPGLKLPDQTIVPVVRSDGAGSSYELSEWMISQYPSLWNSYCSASGRAPACGPTSFYPTVPTGMIAQSGDLGVAGYVSQAYADGSIGYVEYSYALNDHFPVVQMLNAPGTTPSRPRRTWPSPCWPPRSTPPTQQPGPLPDREPHRRLHRPRPPHLPALVVQLPHPAHQGPGPVQRGRGHHPGRLLLLRHVPGPTAVGRARLLAHAHQPGGGQLRPDRQDPRRGDPEHQHPELQQPHLHADRGQPAGRDGALPPGLRQAGADPVHQRDRRGGQYRHRGLRQPGQRRAGHHRARAYQRCRRCTGDEFGTGGTGREGRSASGGKAARSRGAASSAALAAVETCRGQTSP